MHAEVRGEVLAMRFMAKRAAKRPRIFGKLFRLGNGGNDAPEATVPIKETP
jgi:hypothetical protein